MVWTWTGSWWVGRSFVSCSRCVHLWRAPGVACRMSSGSGPARFEESGTLKDRLWTTWRGADGRGTVETSLKCFMPGGGMRGKSCCWRCPPKPMEGVGILPVKLDILCMAQARQEGGLSGGGKYKGAAKRGTGIKEQPSGGRNQGKRQQLKERRERGAWTAKRRTGPCKEVRE